MVSKGDRSTDERQTGSLDVEPSEIANRAFFRLYQASNLMHKVGTRSMASFGTTTQQWAVIGALAPAADRNLGLTVKALMELLMVSRQTITPLLDRLEQRGWIERIKGDPDARSRQVHLTSHGRHAWRQMQSRIAEFYAEALSDFSPKEAATLYQLLDKLKARLSLMQKT